MNKLQIDWFDQDVEQAYIARIKSMIESGNADKAVSDLLENIQTLDTPLAKQCPYLRPQVDGWQEMIEAITEFEGEPITAVHVMLSNDDDLSFENRDSVFQPILEAALYTDELFAFSKANLDQVRAENMLPDRPWYGQGEDIEIFLEFNGIDEFNTALLRHKRQYFFRDQMHELDKLQGMAEGIVPLLYIEFMLCSMYRNALFHKIIKMMVDDIAMPNNIAVLVGTDNMKFDVSSVHIPMNCKKVAVIEKTKLDVEIKREIIDDFSAEKTQTLRQKIIEEKEHQEAAQPIADPESQSMIKRLFSGHYFGRKTAA